MICLARHFKAGLNMFLFLRMLPHPLLNLRPIAPDGFGEEEAEVSSFGNRRADVRRGDFQDRCLDEADAGGRCDFRHRVARARIDDEVVARQDFPGHFPAAEMRPIVGADDEVEFAIGVEAREGRQRVDGIGWAREAELDVADPEARVVADGVVDHLEAELVGEELLLHLERVLGRDDEPYFRQLGIFAEPVGQREVPDVDGIEGAGIDADFALLTHAVVCRGKCYEPVA